MTFTDPQHAIFIAMAGPMATAGYPAHTSPSMRRPDVREDAR